eukprot:gene12499-biopygen12485
MDGSRRGRMSQRETVALLHLALDSTAFGEIPHFMLEFAPSPGEACQSVPRSSGSGGQAVLMPVRAWSSTSLFGRSEPGLSKTCWTITRLLRNVSLTYCNSVHFLAPQRANHVEVLLRKVRWREGVPGTLSPALASRCSWRAGPVPAHLWRDRSPIFPKACWDRPGPP